MILLLDTHVVLWWLAGEPLSEAATRAISARRNDVLVSAVSAWEITLKRALGKLRFDADLVGELERNAFHQLAFTVEHAIAVADLPRVHGDPFDRALLAQARVERATLVTRDAAFGRYDADIIGA